VKLLVVSYELYNHSSVGHCARKIIYALAQQGAHITVVTKPVEDSDTIDECHSLVMNEHEHMFVPFRDTLFLRWYRWLLDSSPRIIRALCRRLDHLRTYAYVFDLRSALWCRDAACTALSKTALCDVIVSISIPQQSHEVGYRLQCSTAKPWIAYFSDPWPTYCNLPFHAWEKSAQRLAHAELAYRHFKAADMLAITNQRMAKRMTEYFPEQWTADKIFILPHSIKEYKDSPSREQSTSRLRIVHAGFLMKMARGVYPLKFREFLKGFARAVKQHALSASQLELVFVGVLDEPDLTVYLEECGLTDYFTFIPKRSYQQTERILQDADILLVMETLSDEGVYFLSKIPDYLAYEKPIVFISPKQGATRDLLKNIPLSAYPGDEDSIFAVWNEVFELWSRAQLDAAVFSRSEVQHLESSVIGREFYRCIEGICNENS
jgi:hypothetical protein